MFAYAFVPRTFTVLRRHPTAAAADNVVCFADMRVEIVVGALSPGSRSWFFWLVRATLDGTVCERQLRERVLRTSNFSLLLLYYVERHSILFDDEIRTNKQTHTHNECSILFTFRDFILIMYFHVPPFLADDA